MEFCLRKINALEKNTLAFPPMRYFILSIELESTPYLFYVSEAIFPPLQNSHTALQYRYCAMEETVSNRWSSVYQLKFDGRSRLKCTILNLTSRKVGSRSIKSAQSLYLITPCLYTRYTSDLCGTIPTLNRCLWPTPKNRKHRISPSCGLPKHRMFWPGAV